MLESSHKSPLRSVTILSAAVAALFSFLSVAGINIAPETGSDINAIVAGLAAVFSIWGRYKATQLVGRSDTTLRDLAAPFLFVFLALSLALGGCASNGASPRGVSESVLVEGTRALVVAEYAYNSVATSVEAATDAGLIKGDTATAIRKANARATEALAVGKATQDVGQRAVAASTVFDVVEELRAALLASQGEVH